MKCYNYYTRNGVVDVKNNIFYPHRVFLFRTGPLRSRAGLCFVFADYSSNVYIKIYFQQVHTISLSA